jgi:hypothetical protein
MTAAFNLVLVGASTVMALPPAGYTSPKPIACRMRLMARGLRFARERWLRRSARTIKDVSGQY